MVVVFDALSRDAVQKPLFQRCFKVLHDLDLDPNNGKIESISAISEMAMIEAGASLDESSNEQIKMYVDLEE